MTHKQSLWGLSLFFSLLWPRPRKPGFLHSRGDDREGETECADASLNVRLCVFLLDGTFGHEFFRISKRDISTVKRGALLWTLPATWSTVENDRIKRQSSRELKRRKQPQWPEWVNGNSDNKIKRNKSFRKHKASHNTTKQMSEILQHISSPDEQFTVGLNLVQKAFTSKQNQFNTELTQLRNYVKQKTDENTELRNQMNEMRREMKDREDKVRIMEETLMKTRSEKDNLLEQVKRMTRELSKLQQFKKSIIASINEDEYQAENLGNGNVCNNTHRWVVVEAFVFLSISTSPIHTNTHTHTHAIRFVKLWFVMSCCCTK